MKNSTLMAALDCCPVKVNPLWIICRHPECGSVYAIARGVTPNGCVIVVPDRHDLEGLAVDEVRDMLGHLSPDMQITVILAGWDDDTEEVVLNESNLRYAIDSVTIGDETTINCRRVLS